jgi:hypothetical protein
LKLNRRLLLLSGAAAEGHPKEGVTSKYGCFEEKIETYLENALGTELFNEIRSEVKSETYVGKLKNPVAMSLFVEKVYDRGKSLPLIEKMVDAILVLPVIPEDSIGD